MKDAFIKLKQQKLIKIKLKRLIIPLMRQIQRCIVATVVAVTRDHSQGLT